MIIGDVPQVTVPLAAGLATEGYRIRTVIPGPALRAVSSDRYEADLCLPESVEALDRLICGREGDRVGCIINLLPMNVPGDRDESRFATSTTYSLFNILKQWQQDLRDSAEEGGGWVYNVTAIDGRFGLGLSDSDGSAAAGTIGLTKAFKREFPQLHVRNIDIDPAIETSLISARLFDEFATGDDHLEIGLTAGKRFRVEVVEKPRPQRRKAPLLDSESVVLVTGGAFGITADAVRSLAASRPTFVLVGRSPLPGEEPAETRDLDLPGLRRHLLEACRLRGEPPLPAEIERQAARLMKSRRIRENLDAFRAAGARVEYHALDVRDAEAFGGLIHDLYARFGRIDGVVHGAGVIHDKLLRDKTPAMFDEVFGTKVESAFVLAQSLRPETLKFFALFSSISGRFGNVGQTDYSAANEVLNKLAGRLARRWPQARVVAINWGPWDAGMVSDTVRQLFASRGISLIAVPEGVECFLSEIEAAGGSEPEVVLSCSVSDMMRLDGGV